LWNGQAQLAVVMMLVPVMEWPVRVIEQHVWRTESACGTSASRRRLDEGGARPQGFTEAAGSSTASETITRWLGLRLSAAADGGHGVGCSSSGARFRPGLRHIGRIHYDAWVKGLNKGRSFVTTGPMLLAKWTAATRARCSALRATADTFCLTGKTLSAYR